MTRPATAVYIATSLDGFIAGPGGDLGWLETGAQPGEGDHGFAAFMDGIDAIVMGRITYEVVRDFDPWPYVRPVHVWSRGAPAIPDRLAGSVFPISGDPDSVLAQLAANGARRVYVDGGATIRAFLERDLIDEMTLTRVPVMLGGGVPLFGELATPLTFELIGSRISGGRLVMSDYRRAR